MNAVNSFIVFNIHFITKKLCFHFCLLCGISTAPGQQYPTFLMLLPDESTQLQDVDVSL